ncbi:Uma2 family endonuclease [Thermomonospora umbrina]|uniref:Putative restriction endonuclease n=1 Tax=Thermomonospora umbrina TaxID=111806 RepID=A0A3D9SHR3_9ACTN|nr:Uma2 family endonuclease [Thermomonospora umbrina]REE95458.1 putative restriction endonuclease [Thermomonospora umbrina]
MVLAVAWEPARGTDGDGESPTLQEVYASLDIPGHRVELLEGRIVVSPAPIRLHNRIVTWLTLALAELAGDRSWDLLARGVVELPATDERVEPDLLVSRVDESSDGEWTIPAAQVRLAVEVVSPFSRRDDYEVKTPSFARSGIPLYLMIDPREALVTLLSAPSPKGYLRAESVPFGGKVELPEPFAIVLDTATMPGLPRDV